MKLHKFLLFFLYLIISLNLVFSNPHIEEYTILDRTENNIKFNITFNEEVEVSYIVFELPNNLYTYSTLTKNLTHNFDGLEKDTEYRFIFELEDINGNKFNDEFSYKTDIYNITDLEEHIFESNQNYTIENDVIATYLNLSNEENVIIGCLNNEKIQADFYDFTNSKNIIFDNCILNKDSSQNELDIIDDMNTNVKFKVKGVDYSINDLNFLNTLGNYFIDKNILDLKILRQSDDSPVLNFDINISSIIAPTTALNQYNFNQDDTLYYLYQNWSNKVNTTYDFFNFSIYSSDTNSSNQTTINSDNIENEIIIYLVDTNKPFLLNSEKLIRNETNLKYNLTFSENVTLTYQVKDTSNNVLETQSSSDFKNYYVLEKGDLEKNSNYFFEFEIEDDEGFKEVFELSYKTDIYNIEDLEGHIFESNQNYTIENDVTATYLNLSNEENIIISCLNDENIEADFYVFTNSKNIIFESCILTKESSQSELNITDDTNTNIKFKTKSINHNIENLNFLNTLGTYFIDYLINITIKEKVSDLEVNSFNLNLSSKILFDNINTYEYSEEDNNFYYLYQNWSNKINTTYSFLNITAYSDETSSYYSNTLDFSNIEDTNIIYLEDMLSPQIYLENSSFNITNESLSMKLIFNEELNITSYYNFSNGENSNFETSNKEINFNFDNLLNNTEYILNLTIYDFSNNEKNITLNFKTFESFSNEDILNFSNSFETAKNVFYYNKENDISFEFLEEINLSKINNIEEIIQIDENKNIFLDTSVFKNNNISIKITYNNLLDYSYKPILLENNTIYDITKLLYENFTNDKYIITLNDSITKNYSITKNSFINYSIDNTYISLPIEINFSLLDFLNKVPINSSCDVSFYLSEDEVVIDTISFSNNLTHKYYFNENYFSNEGNYTFDFTCYSNDLGFENNTLKAQEYLQFETLENFNANLDIVEDIAQDTTSVKEINLSINENGGGSLGSSKYYSFIFLKESSYENSDWNSNNITGFYNIGNNKKVNFYFDEAEDLTYYILENTTRVNMSENIFISKENNEYFGIRIVVISCISSSNCYIGEENTLTNETQTFSFFDKTDPKIDININEYYNSNRVDFYYKIYDIESGINEDRTSFYLTDKNSNEIDLSTFGFIENEGISYSIPSNNFNNRERYNFTIKTENNVNLENSLSYNFLIDNDEPYNLSILEENNNTYPNKNLVKFNLSSFDYNEGSQFEYSDLSHMNIYIENYSIFENGGECYSSIISREKQDFTLTELNKTIELDLEEGLCYDIEYEVFDKANNSNSISLLNKIIVDTTSPIAKEVNGVYVSLDKYTSYTKDDNIVDGETPIFSIEYDFSDEESGIEIIEIELYNGSGSTIDKNIVNLTTTDKNSYDIKYNSSYINEGEKYFVRVRAKNNAQNYTQYYEETNGVIFEILNIPKIKVKENFEEDYFFYNIDNTNNILIFDEITQSSNNISLNTFQTKTLCRWDFFDLDYNSMTNDCNSQDDYNHICSIPISFDETKNTYFSCTNLEDNSINDNTDNFDVKIQKTQNQEPYFSNYEYDIYLNETLEEILILEDDNLEENLFIGFSEVVTSDLNLSFNSTSYEIINIYFENSSSENNFYYENNFIDNYSHINYYFNFNDSITIEDLENLYSSYFLNYDYFDKLKFNYIDNTKEVSNNIQVSQSSSNFFIYGGISKTAYILNEITNYGTEFSLNDTNKYNFKFNSTGILDSLIIIELNLTDNFKNYYTRNITININDTLREAPKVIEETFNKINNSNIYDTLIYFNLTELFESDFKDDLKYSYKNDFNLVLDTTNLSFGIIGLKADNLSLTNSTIIFTSNLNNYENETEEVYFNIKDSGSSGEDGGTPDGGGGSSSGGGGGGSSRSKSNEIENTTIIIEKKIEEYEKEEFLENEVFELEKDKRITFDILNFEYSMLLDEVFEDYSLFKLSQNRSEKIYYEKENKVDIDGDLREDYIIIADKKDNNVVSLNITKIQKSSNLNEVEEPNIEDEKIEIEEKIIEEEVKEEKEEENTIVQKEESSIIPFILIPVILFGSLGASIYYIKQKSFYSRISKDSILEIKKEEINRVVDDNYIKEVLDNYDSSYKNYSKGISFLRSEFLKKIDMGYSWADIFLSLNRSSIKDLFIRNIIDINGISNNFKLLVEELTEKRNFENSKEELLKKSWAKECFVSNSKNLIDGILFLIEGANIYGFKKDNFTSFFKEEFLKSINSFDYKKVNFSSEVNQRLDDLIEIHSQILNIKEKVNSNFLEKIKENFNPNLIKKGIIDNIINFE